MSPLHTRRLLACAVAFSAACMSPTHHVRRMDNRRAPRAETCTPADLPVYNDRGPARSRTAFAVVTAECRESKEDECRTHLRMGGCEVQADALVEVSNQIVHGRRRMVGTAVEFTEEPATSGGDAAR